MSAGISLSRMRLKMVFDIAGDSPRMRLVAGQIDRERTKSAAVRQPAADPLNAPRHREPRLQSRRWRNAFPCSIARSRRQSPDSAAGLTGFGFGFKETLRHRAIEFEVRLCARKPGADDLFVEQLAIDVHVGQHTAIAVT